MFIIYQSGEVVSFIQDGARYVPHCAEPGLQVDSKYAHFAGMNEHNQVNNRWLNQPREKESSEF